MPRKKKSKKEKKQDWLGAGLLIAVIVVLIGVGFLYWHQTKARIEIDKESLCPKAGPKEVCAVIIDQTDEFSTIQRAVLRQHLKAVKEEIPRYGLLELYGVGPVQNELLKPTFKLCNPGRGQEIDPLTGNPVIVERRWREEFSSKLENVFDVVLTPAHAQLSPIMESIQSVAISAFGDPSLSQTAKRLVIVSDLLHHTPEYSQYSDLGDFKKFRATDYYRRVRPNLKDVQVELYYLRRTTRYVTQGQKHIEFWQAYISDAGGTLVRAVSIEG
jgi:hypothetical protein